MATERSVLVRLKANVNDFNRGLLSARATVKGLTDEIDTSNDRTAWLAQSILGLGPAFVPLAAGAVPVVAGLAGQMTFAALAAGTAALAFNGVGDGLKALNDYQLKPTSENMAKLSDAMAKIGPDGEQFVRFLDQAGPKFNELAMTARGGIFPGAEDGITAFMDRLPQLNRIVAEVSSAMGDMARASGQALGGERFDAFFNYLETDAKPILMDMAVTLGSFAEGMANLLVNLGPLTSGFSSGFADMAQSFAEWSRSLDTNDGFQGFLKYVQEAGPMALDFLESLINTFASLVEAAAPVGEILLPALTDLLNIISALAATPLGPVFIGGLAAISLYGRTMAILDITAGGVAGKLFGVDSAVRKQADGMRKALPTFAEFGRAGLSAGRSMESLNKQANTKGFRWTEYGVGAAESAKKTIAARDAVTKFGRAVGPAAGQLGLLALASSGAADKVGLTNTATFALVGSMLGLGAPIGASIGLILDMKKAGDQLADTFNHIGDLADHGGGFAEMTAAIDEGTSKVDQLERFKKSLIGLKGGSDSLGDFLGGFSSAVGSALNNTTLQEYQQNLELLKSTMEGIPQSRAAGGLAAAFEINGAFAPGMREAFKATTDADRALQAYMRSLDVFQGRLSQQQGLIAFRDSLRSLRDVVKDNPLGKALGNGKQGDAIKSQLLTIVSNVHNVAKGMKGLERIEFMRTARRGILDAARKLGLPIPVVRRLLRELGVLDNTNARPGVNEKGSKESRARVRLLRAAIAELKSKMVHMDEKGAAAARARIAAMRREIDALHNKSVTITTNYNGTRTGAAVAGRVARADGGSVYAGMGQSTGPRDDSIPAWLSHREYVMPVMAVDRYGEAMMESIRRGTFPKPAGYADGGSVRAAPRVSVAAPVVSFGDETIRVTIGGEVIDARVDRRMAQHDSVNTSTNRGRTP